MSLNTTTYSASPYHDDYSEDKGILKVLFKPGLSVQTRELNTLQTQLQDQINRVGRHFFDDGDPVIDGGVSIDPSLEFIDVTFTNSNFVVTSTNTAAVVAFNVAQLIKNTTNSTASIFTQEDTITKSNGDAKEVEADIISTEVLSATSALTKYRFFVRYTRRSIGFDKFAINTSLKNTSAIVNSNSLIIVNSNQTIGTVDKVGTCSRLKANEGVYFVDGHFVKLVNQESIIENPQENTPIQGAVSFKSDQTVVQFTSDSSLLDNATGTPNQQAPGADRYKISLTVVLNTDQQEYLNLPFNANKVFDLTPPETSTSKFVTVQEFENGKPIDPVITKYNPETNRFGTTISKRTFEESGNYCLNPFVIDVREAYNDGGNRGRFEASNTTEKETLKSQYSIGIEPSVAYVEGYRVETLNRKEILANKARDKEIAESVSVTSGSGTYVEGTVAIASGGDLPAFGATLKVLNVSTGNGTSGDVTFNNLVKVTSTKYRLFYTPAANSSHAEVRDAFHIGTNSASTNTGFRFTAIGTTQQFKKVYGAENNSKIINLPRDLVSDVTTTSIKITKRIKLADYTATGATTNTIPSGSTDVFYNNELNDYIIWNDTTNAFVVPTAIVINTTNITITTPSGVSTSDVLKIYASVKGTYTLGSKTFASSTETESTGSVTSGTSFSLNNKDVIRITKIVSTGTDVQKAADITATGGSVVGAESRLGLSQFRLDDGQREATYETATLTYTGSTNLQGSIIVYYDHFTHSTSSDQFFSVNSYPVTFDYEDIPSFNGKRLTDVLDFRNLQGSTNAAVLAPNTIIDATIDYYLSRVDQLVVTTSGKFGINKGVPAISPIVPETPSKAMALYNIFLPAYTHDAGRIKIDYIDNRRFTMRDIGALDKKVKNLEYYTSLSLLEKEASDQTIFGTSGERFKSGILVDSFSGHNVGDVTDDGYICAIDGKEGSLRPKFEMNNIGFSISDATQTEDLIRLPSVSTTNLITQDKASVFESLMPYDVVTYQGSLELSPSSDDWKEVQRRPDVIINFDGNADAIEFLANESNVLGTEWNEWQTAWAGATNSTSSQIERSFTRTNRNSTFQQSGVAPRTIDTVQRTVTDQVKRTTTVTVNTTNTGEIRQGTRNSMDISTINESAGDRIVDIKFIPFIRSRRIYFSATGLKPNTKLYAYFDETNVTGYCTKIGVTGMGTSASHTFESRKYRKLLSSDRGEFLNKTFSQVLTSVGDTYKDLITDSLGNIEGYFVIPNTSQIRFRTGDRTFKLSDYSNGIEDQYASTIAKATYSARGLLTTNENTIVSTRKVNFNQDRVRDARTLSKTSIDINTIENVTQVVTDEIIGTTTIPDPRPTARLTRNAGRVDEGGTIIINLTTTNMAAGTLVPYTVTNLESTDYSSTPAGFSQTAGQSSGTGNFTIESDGTATLSWGVAADSDPDESETFILELDNFDQRISVIIGDAVPAPEPPAATPRRTNNWRRDPIAQTFHLSDAGNEDGAFLKELDLYFQAKHPSLPVTVQLVTVENGTPTSAVLPFGEVTLPAASVNISSDASTATTFSFPSAVYIQPGQEYAFIVRSNSTENKIWLGKLGDVDQTTGKKIDKQPAIGVALKSANASTWTPMQDRDVKFVLKAHTFMADTETSRTRNVGVGSTTETASGTLLSVLPSTASTANKIKATAITLQSSLVNFAKTNLSFVLKVATSSGFRRYSIQPNQTIYFDEQIEIGITGDIELIPTLKTTSKFLTPVLDLDRLSLVTINNIVNNDATGEASTGSEDHGNAQARYITRLVKLENPADLVSMFLGVNRPSEDTSIKVYARKTERGEFTELSVPAIEVTSNPNEFKELEVEYNPGSDISEFQIKIVILSSNPAKVCKVNDFRAIATVDV